MNNIKVMKRHFFEGNIIKVLLHLLAWAILIGLPLYLIQRWQIGKDFIWHYYIITLISGIIFYVNYLFLVPKFFFDKKNTGTMYQFWFLLPAFILCQIFLISWFLNMNQEQPGLNKSTGNPLRRTKCCLREAEPQWPDQDLPSVACIFITMHSLHCF